MPLALGSERAGLLKEVRCQPAHREGEQTTDEVIKRFSSLGTEALDERFAEAVVPLLSH
jgi:hypothetical protein